MATNLTQLRLRLPEPPQPVQLAMPLFDAPAGRAARDAGMARALHSGGIVGLTWAEVAYRQLAALCRRQATVHTDDLAPLMAGYEAVSPNAWGAVWMRARQAKLIARSGEYRNTKQPGKHYHAYPVWRSLVYQQGSIG